jgi:hypothetical protein
MTIWERMQVIQLEEIPAAAAEVRRTHKAYLEAVARKDGLCAELRDLAGQMIDQETGAGHAA